MWSLQITSYKSAGNMVYGLFIFLIVLAENLQKVGDR